MPSNRKEKGNRGERELSKLLSPLFGGNFARVPTSGAMVGGKNAFRRETLSDTQNKIFKGDLIPPDHMPHCVLECKSYKDFLFHQLITPNACPQLDEWIQQTLECVDEGDCWFVCIKITRLGWFICVPDSIDYQFGNYARYSGTLGTFRITGMNEFFKTNREMVLRLSA